jgi:histidinol-phosphate aminotransferase
MRATVRPRAAVLELPSYRAGRSAADAMAAYGLRMAIKLASNEAPYGPLPSVRAAIDESLSELNRYPAVSAQPLRAELAESLGLEPAAVAVGAGSSGLLWQISAAFLEPGDDVVFPWPSFEGYPILARLAGARPVQVPLRDQTADVDALLEAVTPTTKLVLVADPNNPTGTAVPAGDIQKLVDGLAGRCLLVVDEAYLEFRDRPGNIPPGELLAASRDVIVLRTFSKAYGLAGLRVGYACGDPLLIDVIDRVAPPFVVSSVGQAAAIASLRAEDELGSRIDAVIAERARVTHALCELGWPVPHPQGNFVWLPVRAAAEGLAEALEQRGVVTRCFPGWGVRVTIGEPPENDLFLTHLADARRLDGRDP